MSGRLCALESVARADADHLTELYLRAARGALDVVVVDEVRSDVGVDVLIHLEVEHHVPVDVYVAEVVVVGREER